MPDRPAPPLPAVRLRPLSPDDLNAHAAGCDDLVNRWANGGHVSTDEEHLAWLRRSADAAASDAPVLDLGIEDADTSEHVGVVGIQRGLSYLRPGEVNLTYTVYAGRRRRGYAVAATLAAMRWALSPGPVDRFLIRCDAANQASAAVARRLGFAHVGPVAEPDGWVGDRYVWEMVDGRLPGSPY